MTDVNPQGHPPHSATGHTFGAIEHSGPGAEVEPTVVIDADGVPSFESDFDQVTYSGDGVDLTSPEFRDQIADILLAPYRAALDALDQALAENAPHPADRAAELLAERRTRPVLRHSPKPERSIAPAGARTCVRRPARSHRPRPTCGHLSVAVAHGPPSA